MRLVSHTLKFYHVASPEFVQNRRHGRPYYYHDKAELFRNEAPRTWPKVINPNYSQHRGRCELFDKFHDRVQASERPTSS